MNKKIIVLMIFLAIILSCTAISATDSNCVNETITINEEMPLEDSSNEPTTNAEFKTFGQLNENIASNSQVDLDSNYVYSQQSDEDYKDGIVIDKTVTINGHGFAINSTNASKLFNVKTNGNLTLNDVILLSDYGDTKRVESSFKNLGNVILNNVTFITTQTKIDTSGALSSSFYNTGTLTITNSRFIDSIITTNRQSFYGLIDNAGTLIIEDTIFDNISLIESSQYTNNIYATDLIYNTGNLTLNRVNVTNNFMETPGSILGLIRGVDGSSSKILINNSRFENNSVESGNNNANGVVIYATAGTLTILNSKFIKTTGARGAGVIYSKIPNTFINNIFEKNTVSDNGGVIYSQGDSTYINNTFKGNSAKQGGAIYTAVDLQPNQNLLFKGNTFIDNKASKEGGAIYSEGTIGTASLPIEDNVFINNEGGEKGGAIFLRGSWQSKSIFAKRTLFQDNYALDGSAIYNYLVTGANVANITYSIFENNYQKAINAGTGSSAEYNYWGTNSPDFNTLTRTFTPTNIVVISIEGNETLKNKGEYIVNFKDNGTSETVKLMPTYTVDLKSKLNAVPKSTVINEGQITFTYIAEKIGDEIIKVMKNDEKITHIEINVIGAIKKPIFNINANDINYNEKLDFKFTIIEGPEGNNIYNWTILDNNKNIMETGHITENNEINYKNEYPIGNYTIIVKLSNYEGWQDLEMNDSFEIKEIKNETTPDKTDTNTTTQQNATQTTATQAATETPTAQPAKTKIIAKNKTFKASKNVKKYAITLKAGKKPVKKVWVTLKIKGKTYKAKTNSKGKATFKIKKLIKKGKYKAVIKFKGNANYKSSSKQVKITIK